MTKEFIDRVIEENAVDTKKYHYWCDYQYAEDEIVIYRCPQSAWFFGIAHRDVEIVCKVPC